MALLNLWHGRQAKKVPLNMRKMYGFTPTGKWRLRNVASTLCARWDIFQLPCMQFHPGLWSRFIHFAVSNESLADSEDSDQAVHPRSLPSGPSLSNMSEDTFSYGWQIYGWFFKLFSLISWYLNIHCAFIYFMLFREREREREGGGRERESFYYTELIT